MFISNSAPKLHGQGSLNFYVDKIVVAFALPWQKRNKKKNKLGQRQSQTPLVSAFWVQKDFGK